MSCPTTAAPGRRRAAAARSVSSCSHPARQRGQHHLRVGGRDEHVDVDVDRAPRPLGAPRQRERATERVRQPGAVERERAPRRSCRPARVRSPTGPSSQPRSAELVNFLRCMCARCSREPGKATSGRDGPGTSRPARAPRSAPDRAPHVRRDRFRSAAGASTSKANPAARSTRSSVSTFGVVRPDSYADSVECDVCARSPSSRSVSPPSIVPSGSGHSAPSTTSWYRIRYHRPTSAVQRQKSSAQVGMMRRWPVSM